MFAGSNPAGSTGVIMNRALIIIIMVITMTNIFLPQIYHGYNGEKRIGLDVPFPNESAAQEVADKTGINLATIGSLILEDNTFAKYDVSVPALFFAGIDPIMILHGTIPQMREQEGRGIVKLQYWKTYEDYPNFCRQAAQRYNSQVKYIQIWNEPDVKPEYSVPNYYGGWGYEPTLFADFVNSCAAKIKQVSKAKLAISLAGDLTWLKLFTAAGGTESIDFIYLHYYAWEGDDLTAAVEEIENRIKIVEEITSLPVWLTEVNLLASASTPAYEIKKKEFVYLLEEVLDKTDVLMVYSWQSGWNNADVRNLPAEEAVRYLAEKYNLLP